MIVFSTLYFYFKSLILKPPLLDWFYHDSAIQISHVSKRFCILFEPLTIHTLYSPICIYIE